MKVQETPPDQKRLDLIQAVIVDAASLLDVDLKRDSPQAIMQKVNDAVVDLVFERPSPVSEDENPHLVLGALWGAQMARQFHWYWADVVIDEEFKEVAMISPNQEMIIFPFSFTAACIDKQCICTILLAFNMLLENDRIGEISPGTYENIMLMVHHIVPPYELE
ncbi:MAG TPA: hypothetical protein DDY91_08605 [Planctomycetaceae bacterium]|nr:hypothetical protein [Planctomycetaceae bacterium]